MEQIDRLLPILILGIVATILLVLLRRKTTDPARLHEVRPMPVAAELVQTESRPVVAAAIEKRCEPVVQETKAAPKARRKQPPPVPAPPPPVSTIETVLGLLHDRQTLAAAFLLREVLAPPVSRRPCLPRNC